MTHTHKEQLFATALIFALVSIALLQCYTTYCIDKFDTQRKDSVFTIEYISSSPIIIDSLCCSEY